ncbi:MAG: hypothetical protein PHR77_02410, partial [Kiritimatiellae bacterium]|nr:hypothetical protein [Kiritimatiellia bacterium]
VGGSRKVTVVTAIAFAALFLWDTPFKLHHGKYYEETGKTTPIYEKWTPTARITVFDNLFFFDKDAPFGWGIGSTPVKHDPPRQYWLEQDASAGSPIINYEGDLSRVQFLLSDVTTLGYQLRPPKTVAIIGAGGGRDILSALVTGAREVDAIELNHGIVAAMRGPFGAFSGHVYDLPGVKTIIGEGRSVLTRSNRLYDLIQISLIDSWAATAAGAYSLSENNLYTIEAYRLYWSRLGPRGMVSTTRWMRGGFRLEIPRLLMLVKAALQAEGISCPEAHIAMAQGGSVGTVLMSRIPFDETELRILRDIASRRGFVLHVPITNLPDGQQQMKQALDAGPELYRPHGFVMDPPTDNRPFFFQVLSPFQAIPKSAVQEAGVNAEGVMSLQRLMLMMSALTLVLFFTPFFLTRWLRPQYDFWQGSLFFACIGLAFMFVELAWLQRFILFLGHPSLATTVALGSILLGAGAGSMTSERLGVSGGQRFGFLLPATVVVLNLALSPLFTAALGLSLILRVVIAMAVMLPAGFLMGFCFPLGMVRFGGHNQTWFWAINGAAGVLASVVSLAISMKMGFSYVAYAGAGIYAIAWLLLFDHSSSSAHA